MQDAGAPGTSAAALVRRVTPKPSLTAPLRVRNYRLLWLGESVSVLGDQFYLVALPWLALQLTGSGLVLGSVLMTAAVPRAAFMLVGGAVTDRFSPRTTMLASNIFRCLLVGTLAGLVLLDVMRLWHVYVLSAAFGAFDAFFYPAYVSILPTILESDQLPAGNSLLQSTAQLTGLIGPAAAGLMIGATSVGTAMAVDAASFLVSVAMLTLIRPQPVAPPAHGSLVSSIAEGIRYVVRHSVLRGMLISMTAINVCVMGPFAVGASLLAKQRFSGAAALGAMYSAFGGGSLLGALVAGVVPTPRMGPLLLSVAVAAGLGMSALGFVHSLWLASAVLIGVGLVAGFASVHFMAFLQQSTESDRMGRVMSLLMFGSQGLLPLSYIAAGVIGEVGVRLLFLASGVGVLLTCGLVATRRGLWQGLR